jgi:hypothetical protein
MTVLPVRRFFVLPGAIGVTPGCNHSTRGIKRDTLNNFKERALPAEVSRKQRALLTRQVLSSTVTIRLEGSRAALRRQIKLTLTAAFESPIPQSISEGGGDSGARWHLRDFFASAANH